MPEHERQEALAQAAAVSGNDPDEHLEAGLAASTSSETKPAGKSASRLKAKGQAASKRPKPRRR
jgi:hypothetical protein